MKFWRLIIVNDCLIFWHKSRVDCYVTTEYDKLYFFLQIDCNWNTNCRSYHRAVKYSIRLKLLILSTANRILQRAVNNVGIKSTFKLTMKTCTYCWDKFSFKCDYFPSSSTNKCCANTLTNVVLPIWWLSI